GLVTIVKLGKIALDVDVERTRAIYSQITSASSIDCGCIYCKNYRKAHPFSLQKEVLDFLVHCGVDLEKDADIYFMDDREGEYCKYGGEYYIVCKSLPKIDSDKLPDGFEFVVTYPSPVIPTELREISGVMCFSFMSLSVPWVLEERS
ncbi:TPA: hypothetical protein ACGUUT_004387, partial [Vibrio vulnificus]